MVNDHQIRPARIEIGRRLPVDGSSLHGRRACDEQ
jgi:hypothetical protein